MENHHACLVAKHHFWLQNAFFGCSLLQPPGYSMPTTVADLECAHGLFVPADRRPMVAGHVRPAPGDQQQQQQPVNTKTNVGQQNDKKTVRCYIIL